MRRQKKDWTSAYAKVTKARGDKGGAARVTNAREADPSAGSADEGEWESMY